MGCFSIVWKKIDQHRILKQGFFKHQIQVKKCQNKKYFASIYIYIFNGRSTAPIDFQGAGIMLTYCASSLIMAKKVKLMKWCIQEEKTKKKKIERGKELGQVLSPVPWHACSWLGVTRVTHGPNPHPHDIGLGMTLNSSN